MTRTMTIGRWAMCGLTLTLLAACAARLPAKPGVQTPVQAQAGRYPFQLFLPKQYRTHGGQTWPLLIFLHGSGERGTDIAQVKVHGPPKLAAAQPDYPFITLSPLLEADGDWDIARLEATMRHVRARLHIDGQRIYLTGLSRGAHASWRWAAARPDMFAAVVPISGRGNPATACALRHLPIWAFHGAQDTIVPPTGTTDMVTAINRCGGQAMQTVYPDAGHDAWTRSYDNPDLNRWLLSKRKPG